jgi:hypothetical protein
MQSEESLGTIPSKLPNRAPWHQKAAIHDRIKPSLDVLCIQ